LETLSVDIDAFRTIPSSEGEQEEATELMAGLKFRGHGSNPYDRVQSMQAQLTAFSAAPNFLHPSCWPSHTCLTALDIRGPVPMLQKDSIFEVIGPRALRIPSLEALHLDVCGLPALPTSVKQCFHILSLTRLTSLTVTTAASTSTSLHVFWESIGGHASLRKLHIWLQKDCTFGPNDAVTFTIPPSWTHLSCLSDLQLLHATWYTNPAALVQLTGLQSLGTHCAAQQLPQILHSCAQLPSLTSLSLYDIDEHLQAAPQAVGQLIGGPCSSSSPLQVLQLPDFQGMSVGQLQLFPGLTQLTLWGDLSEFPNGHLRRLASLQLLQHLKLQCIVVTQELCW
jgi:hypothetical protein